MRSHPMRRLALALLIVLVAGCVTYPPPKIENGRYQNYKYGFVLDLPGSDWVLMEKPPPQLTGVTPREMRKQIMLALFNKEISAAIIVVAEKTMLFRGLIFQSDSLQAAILAEFSKQPDVKDARDCHDSRTYMHDWDICIEFDFEDAVSKAKGNMFMRLFLVGNDVHIVMVQLGSNHITYEQSFPAFVKVINSLRCGEYYRTVPDMLEVAEDVHLGKEAEKIENNAQAYYNRGLVYYEEDQYDEAISNYTKAIEINPRYAAAYYYRGLAYYYKDHWIYYNYKGKYDQAISDLNKAIELNSRFAEAYYNRGLVYAEKRQYEQAISDYNKAIEINPHYTNAYFRRGRTYYNQGQYQRAIENFDQVLRLNPDHTAAEHFRENALLFVK